jgi:hypothetical protein
MPSSGTTFFREEKNTIYTSSIATSWNEHTTFPWNLLEHKLLVCSFYGQVQHRDRAMRSGM